MIIVTGMPRSGTSLMMWLLFYLDYPICGRAFPKFRDKAHNPNGYWESPEFLCGRLDGLDDTEEFAVKVDLRKAIEKVNPDPAKHKIILCQRNIQDMADSQIRTGYAPSSTKERCLIQIQKWYGKFDAWAGSTPVLKVNLDTLKANKTTGMAAIKTFIGADRDITKAVSIVEPLPAVK